MDVLGDTREVLRNDALILLFKLTKGKPNNILRNRKKTYCFFK